MRGSERKTDTSMEGGGSKQPEVKRKSGGPCETSPRGGALQAISPSPASRTHDEGQISPDLLSF